MSRLANATITDCNLYHREFVDFNGKVVDLLTESDAIQILAGEAGARRSEAIDFVYSRSGFTKEECASALAALGQWPEYRHAAGAIYYILESSYRLLGSWPEPALVRRIAKSLPDYDFSANTWSGEMFLVWWCSKKEKGLFSLGKSNLPAKAKYIALDYECTASLKHVLRVLFGLDDFSDVYEEVHDAFMLRSTFSPDEFELAKSTLMDVQEFQIATDPCLKVILTSLPSAQVDAFFEEVDLRNRSWGRELRGRVRKLMAGTQP